MRTLSKSCEVLILLFFISSVAGEEINVSTGYIEGIEFKGYDDVRDLENNSFVSLEFSDEKNRPEKYQKFRIEGMSSSTYAIAQFNTSKVELYEASSLEKNTLEPDSHIARLETNGEYYVMQPESGLLTVNLDGECVEKLQRGRMEPDITSCSGIESQAFQIIYGYKLIPMVLTFILIVLVIFRSNKFHSNNDSKINRINKITEDAESHPEKYSNEELEKIYKANKLGSKGKEEEALEIIRKIS